MVLLSSPNGHTSEQKWGIVLHGGAGVIDRASMDAKMEKSYRRSLDQALKTGAEVLKKDGSALNAVEAAIRLLEDDPLFNAGRGAVFTADGKNELDASIMDGATRKAGAVAAVTQTRHPISLARAVMEKSPHVMLIGQGADAFGKEIGIEQAEPGFFFTERRWQELVQRLQKEGRPIPERPDSVLQGTKAPVSRIESSLTVEYGTVGVVAVDRTGNLASGTSTGGTPAKRWGRVGDSPIIGAGTYASNESCAVSATGTGEFFIRLTIAREVCALVQYKGMPLQAAADEVIQGRLTAIGGNGGVIAMKPDGEIAWSFNTPGMYRARWSEGKKPVVSIYKDEP